MKEEQQDIKYPELEKMAKIQDSSQKIGFFLDWLFNNFTLCQHTNSVNTVLLDALEDYEAKDDSLDECIKAAISNGLYEKGGYLPARVNIQELLASYFGIDVQKMEDEKRQILKTFQVGKDKLGDKEKYEQECLTEPLIKTP